MYIELYKYSEHHPHIYLYILYVYKNHSYNMISYVCCVFYFCLIVFKPAASISRKIDFLRASFNLIINLHKQGEYLLKCHESEARKFPNSLGQHILLSCIIIVYSSAVHKHNKMIFNKKRPNVSVILFKSQQIIIFGLRFVALWVI